MEKTDNVKWGTSPIEQLRELQRAIDEILKRVGKNGARK